MNLYTLYQPGWTHIAILPVEAAGTRRMFSPAAKVPVVQAGSGDIADRLVASWNALQDYTTAEIKSGEWKKCSNKPSSTK